MKIHKIETGNFKLDGGAVFGVVPKTIWSKNYDADANNLVNCALRCMLIEEGDRKILIDTGVGDKQDEKFFSYYYLNGDDTLERSLKAAGCIPEDITDVIITHLHFDHVGGACKWNEDKTKVVPTFKNAKYHIGKEHWNLAMNPNPREKASFLKENMLALEENGLINFITKNQKLTDNIELRLYYGHTEGMIVPFIKYGDKTIVYAADLIPIKGNLPLSYVCGYDVQPLVSMEEKKVFLQEVLDKNYILFFEHDIENECCKAVMTEKGIRAGDSFTLESVL